MKFNFSEPSVQPLWRFPNTNGLHKTSTYVRRPIVKSSSTNRNGRRVPPEHRGWRQVSYPFGRCESGTGYVPLGRNLLLKNVAGASSRRRCVPDPCRRRPDGLCVKPTAVVVRYCAAHGKRLAPVTSSPKRTEKRFFTDENSRKKHQDRTVVWAPFACHRPRNLRTAVLCSSRVQVRRSASCVIIS